jgi:hypothetical protein
MIKIVSDIRPDKGYIIIDDKDFNPDIHIVYSDNPQPEPITEPITEVITEVVVDVNSPETTLKDLVELEGVGKATAEQLLELREETPLTLELLIEQFPRVKWSELNLIF